MGVDYDVFDFTDGDGDRLRIRAGELGLIAEATSPSEGDYVQVGIRWGDVAGLVAKLQSSLDAESPEDGRVDESQVESIESYEYGELWPDGTFKMVSHYEEDARKDLDRRTRFDYKRIPETLRPIVANRKIVTTTETFPAEAVTP